MYLNSLFVLLERKIYEFVHFRCMRVLFGLRTLAYLGRFQGLTPSNESVPVINACWCVAFVYIYSYYYCCFGMIIIVAIIASILL